MTIPREGYEDTIFIPKCETHVVEKAISEAVELGLIWLINGPASILGEQVHQDSSAPPRLSTRHPSQ